jgi:hypothetical protein
MNPRYSAIYLVGVGIALRLLLVPSQAIADEQSPYGFWSGERLPLQILMDANSLNIHGEGTTILSYPHSGVLLKPYVKELRTPAGINVLLDAPSDHSHHHALMFACAVNKVDFWSEAVGVAEGQFEPQPGKQRHLRFDEVRLSSPGYWPVASFTEAIRWISKPSNEPLAIERRTIRVTRLARCMFVTWETCLATPPGRESIMLSGSHYHGLGMRFVRSMDITGEFRNADNDGGVVFRGTERLTPSQWCAYTAQADGKTVTVAMFDHPENPRHPATWFTMAEPFAYMSATLRLHEKPLEVLADKPLTLRYGVGLWDGRPETSEIERHYQLLATAWNPTTAHVDPEIAKP